jgi:pimeloyl-ACP methyl ester carboxylesterase
MSVVTLQQTHAGAGVPLVVFPGLSGRGGTSARFERWAARREIAALSGSRAVWRIHRRIGLEQGISVPDLAADYAAELQRLFHEPVDVVGVSTGGSIALQLAADHPELVRRLVLVSAAHRLSDEGRNTQREVAALLRGHHPRRAAALFLGATGATSATRAILAMVGLLLPCLVVGRNDADLLRTLDAEDAFDLAPRLGAMTTPTLVTGGARDRYYGTELFEGTHAAMPQARLKLYPRSGHISTFGNRTLARHILRYLESPDG